MYNDSLNSSFVIKDVVKSKGLWGRKCLLKWFDSLFHKFSNELCIDVKLLPPLITCCWRWSCAESSPAPDTCRTFELIYDDKISTEGKTAPVLNSGSGASFRTFLAAFRFLALTTSGVLMSSFWMIETPMAVAKLLHPSRFSKLIVTIWVTGVYRWSPTEPPPAQQRTSRPALSAVQVLKIRRPRTGKIVTILQCLYLINGKVK